MSIGDAIFLALIALAVGWVVILSVRSKREQRRATTEINTDQMAQPAP